MHSKIEQRVCIKFCVLNQTNQNDTYKLLLKCYGDECLSKTQVIDWYKQFKEGRVNVEDGPRSGKPTTSNDHQHIEKVKELLLANRRYSIKDLADKIGVSVCTCNSIVSDALQLKPVNGRLVPKFLNFLEKQRRLDISKEILAEHKNDDTFIKRIITGSETWLYITNEEEESLDSESDESDETEDEIPKKKPRQSRTKVEIMITVFFDSQGIIYYEFLPIGQIPDNDFHLTVMCRLRGAIFVKRPELFKNNSWILHYDNLTTRTTYIVRDYLTKHITNQIDQPPYSPDLTPSDYFLFPKLKAALLSYRFETIEAFKEETIRIISAIPQTDYKNCMEHWLKRLSMCAESEGNYIEGDNINFNE